jgi:hypothetical protein
MTQMVKTFRNERAIAALTNIYMQQQFELKKLTINVKKVEERRA